MLKRVTVWAGAFVDCWMLHCTARCGEDRATLAHDKQRRKSGYPGSVDLRASHVWPAPQYPLTRIRVRIHRASTPSRQVSFLPSARERAR